MAASPPYKVFSADGRYNSAFREIDDAAQYVAIQGVGWEIRYGHSKNSTIYIADALDDDTVSFKFFDRDGTVIWNIRELLAAFRAAFRERRQQREGRRP